MNVVVQLSRVTASDNNDISHTYFASVRIEGSRRQERDLAKNDELYTFVILDVNIVG